MKQYNKYLHSTPHKIPDLGIYLIKTKLVNSKYLR